MEEMTRCYCGYEAGCIGHTANGYPIRDYFIVRVVPRNDFQDGDYFQVHKIYGIVENGVWKKVELAKVYRNNYDDPPYYEPVYIKAGKEIPLKDLTVRYEITEMTDLVKGNAALARRLGSDSPYVNRILLEFSSERMLDPDNPEDWAIIQAVKEFIYPPRDEKERER